MPWAPRVPRAATDAVGPLHVPGLLGFYSWKEPPSITCGSKFLSRVKLGQPGVFKLQKTFVANKKKEEKEVKQVEERLPRRQSPVQESGSSLTLFLQFLGCCPKHTTEGRKEGHGL